MYEMGVVGKKSELVVGDRTKTGVIMRGPDNDGWFFVHRATGERRWFLYDRVDPIRIENPSYDGKIQIRAQQVIKSGIYNLDFPGWLGLLCERFKEVEI